MSDRLSFLVYLVVALFAVSGCKSKEKASEAGTENKPLSLNGAGATFPYPLYSKWMAEYNRVNPSVRINYQSIGSGGGIRQVIAGTVDFGASDAPMTEDEAKKAPSELLHIPTTIGAVVLAYNLPDSVTGTLKLSPEVITDIFLGKVDKWNHTALTELNPDMTLPDAPIRVIYRTDGSGTTAVFTDYLAAVSSEWKEKVGAGKSVKWPVGLGAKGNEGVTGQVRTTPGALGYIELAYAKQNKMKTAAVKNKAGNFTEPTIEASSAAAAGVEMPPSLHASLANPEGPTAYPIASYTYLLVYADSKDPAKGEAIAKFLWWALHDGQKFAADLDYAPLPAKVVAKVEARLKSLHSGGKTFLSGL
jgi:phosphate transport system substrate-binding protein